MAAGAALGIASGVWAADPCPELRQRGKTVSVRVSPATMRALRAAAPGFQPWTLADYAQDTRSHYPFTTRQVPWAVVGDFDGDGWCDLVIDGRDKSTSLRLCVWGSEEGAKVMTLGRRPLPPKGGRSAALRFVPPGEIVRHSRDEPIALATDGFGELAAGRALKIYYWEGGRFRAGRSVATAPASTPAPTKR